MKKSDLKHMAELALIRAIPDLIVGGLERGRLKNLMRRLQKAVDMDLGKIRRPNKRELDWIWNVVETFKNQSGWGRKNHHPGTLVCFCQAVVDRSDRKFNNRIIELLNEISDYYDRAGELYTPSLWSADLACKKWLALFGIHEEEGKPADVRLKEIDDQIAREHAMEEYREKFYPKKEVA